jgi:hypothetical protein
MTKKTFYLNLKEQSFNQIKIVSKELVGKSLIRNTIKNREEIKIIDTNSNIVNIKASKDIQRGETLCLNQFIFRNKFNTELKLDTFLGETSLKKKLIEKYKNSFLSTLKTKSVKKKEPVIILECIKGGFIVYNSGLCGFLPRSQYWSAWDSILKNNVEKSKIAEMLNFKSLLPIRLPLKITKVSLYPDNKHLNFSNSKRTKNLVGTINIVFVHKRTNFKKDGEQKTKKKDIQLNSERINDKIKILSGRKQLANLRKRKIKRSSK